jgi:AraC-like DNA-binding protein
VADAVEFGREVVRPTYDLGLSRDRSDHWYHTDIWLVGPMLFARNAGDGHVLLRESRHLAANPGHYLKLQIFEEAGGVLFGPDATEPLEARAVRLIDQSRPYRQEMPAGRNLTVFIPHTLLDYRSGAAAHIRFAADSAEGGFLSRSTEALFDQLPGLTIGHASGVAGAYAGLLKALLDWRLSRLGGEGIREVRLDAARRYIEANLHDPDLRPDDVLGVVGASRATLFRDFAALGGLEGYIRERRLDRAYRALSMSAPQRGVVGTVAGMSGFPSTADLSRSFQRRYGLSPTEVVGQWYKALTGEPAATPRAREGLLDALRAVYAWSDPAEATDRLSSP